MNEQETNNSKVENNKKPIGRWIFFAFLVVLGIGGLSFSYSSFLILIAAILIMPSFDDTLRKIKLTQNIKIIIAIILTIIGFSISTMSPKYIEYENNKKNEEKIKENAIAVKRQKINEEKMAKEQKKNEEKIKAEEQSKKEAEEKAKVEAQAKKEQAEKQKQQEEQHKQYIEEQKKEGINNLKEIRKAYKQNELAARDKYKDNTYNLYAQFSAIKEDGVMNKLLSKIGVTLTFKDSNNIVYIFCNFDKNQRDALAKYKQGDYILFSGVCSSWGNWYDCKVIE